MGRKLKLKHILYGLHIDILNNTGQRDLLEKPCAYKDYDDNQGIYLIDDEGRLLNKPLLKFA